MANNEFSLRLRRAATSPTLEGDYDYVLPSLDFAIGRDRQHEVARQLRREHRPAGLGRHPGRTDAQPAGAHQRRHRPQGNPGLKPLESKNIDLSFEWYYAEGSYLSVGYFHKDIDNYVGVTTIIERRRSTCTHPVAGRVLQRGGGAGGCPTADLTCIRNFIFDNHDGDPGVTRDGRGFERQSHRHHRRAARRSDRRPSRSRCRRTSARPTLDGWEFNIQHMFGDSGFGVSANYTLVDSDLKYDNHDRGEQFALEGLSDSANLVAFYEKYGWSVRAAYNWRDEFLAGRFDGTGLPNPVYTEAYGQLDLNASYNVNDNLTLHGRGDQPHRRDPAPARPQRRTRRCS